MSFDFKGPSYRPMIQESQNMQNNGGGGNLGYFQRGKKDEDKKDESADLFETATDSFEAKIEDNKENSSSFDKVKNFVNNWVEKAKDCLSPDKKANPFM